MQQSVKVLYFCHGHWKKKIKASVQVFSKQFKLVTYVFANIS